MRLLILPFFFVFFQLSGQTSTFYLGRAHIKVNIGPTTDFVIASDTNYYALQLDEGLRIKSVSCTGASCEVLDNRVLQVVPWDLKGVKVAIELQDTVTEHIGVSGYNLECIPKPLATINSVPNDSLMMSMECLLAGKVDARFSRLDVDLQVDSFKLSTVRDGVIYDLASNSNGLTKDMRLALFEPKISQEAYFYDIWVSWGGAGTMMLDDYRIFVLPDVEKVLQWSTGEK